MQKTHNIWLCLTNSTILLNMNWHIKIAFLSCQSQFRFSSSTDFNNSNPSQWLPPYLVLSVPVLYLRVVDVPTNIRRAFYFYRLCSVPNRYFSLQFSFNGTKKMPNELVGWFFFFFLFFSQ